MKPPEGLAGLAAREAGHLEEPPPADARLLALANRALVEILAELETEVFRLRAAVSPEALDLVPAFRMMQSVAKERAAVVSWLRQLAESCDTEAGTQSLLEAAGDIERGEHREGEP